jgi:hypothetical protein
VNVHIPLLTRKLGQHHEINRLGVWQHLNLWFLYAWCWRSFNLNCSLGHALQVVVSNCVVAVGARKSSKAACGVFDRIICIFILCDKCSPG